MGENEFHEQYLLRREVEGMVFHTQQIFCQHQLTKGDRSENIPYPTLTKGGRGGDGVSESYPTLTKGDKKTSFKLSAFSIIELSIVLIIMGLLVAGVTGGQSLIQSAKARTFLNELNGWKQSFNALYVAKGGFPGDIKNKGIFGYESGYSYPAGTFASLYDTSAQGVYNAPYIEMYLEKVSDFEPLSGNCNDDFANVKAKCVPLSNVLKNSFYEFVYYN